MPLGRGLWTLAAQRPASAFPVNAALCIAAARRDAAVAAPSRWRSATASAARPSGCSPSSSCIVCVRRRSVARRRGAGVLRDRRGSACSAGCSGARRRGAGLAVASAARVELLLQGLSSSAAASPPATLIGPRRAPLPACGADARAALRAPARASPPTGTGSIDASYASRVFADPQRAARLAADAAPRPPALGDRRHRPRRRAARRARADLEAHRPFSNLSSRAASTAPGACASTASAASRVSTRAARLRRLLGRRPRRHRREAARSARAASETRYRELFERSPSPLVLHRAAACPRRQSGRAATVRLRRPATRWSASSCMRLLSDRSRARARRARASKRWSGCRSGRACRCRTSQLRSRDGQPSACSGTGVRVERRGRPGDADDLFDDTERRGGRGRAAPLARPCCRTWWRPAPTDHADRRWRRGRYVMVNDSLHAPHRLRARRGDRPHRDRARPLAATRATASGCVAAMRRARPHDETAGELRKRDGGAASMLLSAARFEMDGRDYLVINARDVTDTERTRLEHEAMLENASIGIALHARPPLRAGQPALRADASAGAAGALAGQPGRVVWPSDDEYAEIGAHRRAAAGAGRAGRVRARDAAPRRQHVLVPPARPRRSTRRHPRAAARSGSSKTSPSAAASSRRWPRRATRPRRRAAPRARSWPTPATRSARRSTACSAWRGWRARRRRRGAAPAVPRPDRRQRARASPASSPTSSTCRRSRPASCTLENSRLRPARTLRGACTASTARWPRPSGLAFELADRRRRCRRRVRATRCACARSSPTT